MENITPKNYLQVVWWAEQGLLGWEVRYGYLLATYKSIEGTKHIVTLGD